MNNSPERTSSSHERESNPEELEKAGVERREQLHENLEKNKEQSPEALEKVRHEALENATSSEQKEDPIPSNSERKRGPISRTERDASFDTTLTEVRNHMSAPSRAFSKVIHIKAVEKVSDAASATIARPNAILTGSIFASALTLGAYLLAKNLGYSLSGFETIGAFVVGWLLGLSYDFLKTMITGK